MMALVFIATRAGFIHPHFPAFSVWRWEILEQLQISKTPVARKSRALPLSHFQPPATMPGLQFLDADDSVASGCGVWWLALQDIVFLALASGNVFHVFPCVYRLEGTECSLWQGSWADRTQLPVPGPSSRSNMEMEPQALYGLRSGQHPAPCGRKEY